MHNLAQAPDMSGGGMALADLVQGLAPAVAGDSGAIEVRGLSMDARTLAPGDAFLAVAGGRHHGLEFAAQAEAAGAVVVLYDPKEAPQRCLQVLRIPQLPVVGLRAQCSELGARFFARPSESMELVAVTGTNGKTSVCWLLAQAWSAAHQPGAVMGTLGVGALGALRDTGMTTPDALRVQSELARLLAAGYQRCAIEVSSHALDQQRVQAVDLDVTVFTNLSRDHLDYHGDLQRYAAAKASLFQSPGSRHAVINVADAFGRELLLTTEYPVIRYGTVDAEVFASEVRVNERGLRFCLHLPGFSQEIASPLLGAFNVSNLLATAAVLLAQGFSSREVAALMPDLQAPGGRMQRIGVATGQPTVIVDFAHTPDALAKALQSARQLCRGQLVCVFGCGGERDTGKRPLMGQVAAVADRVVLTEDNSRSEDTEAICAQILAGMPRDCPVRMVPDRATAIESAIAEAAPEDLVLLAGKGHETTLQRATGSVPFSDQACARRALSEREARP